MIQPGIIKKIVITLIGLVSGIILFLASFSMLLDGILFNSEFQKKVFDNLGIYESVTEMAGTFSSDMKIQETDINPIVNSTSFTDLINLNTKSIIEGLINYFKGNTDELPDLDLIANSDNRSTSSISAINDASVYTAFSTGNVQSLANLEKINLRVIIMIFGERYITDIMLVISLFQYILRKTFIFGLMLFLNMFAIMLHTNRRVLYVWLKSTAASCLLLCLASGFLILFVLYYILPDFLNQIELFEPIYPRILTRYITYCTNILSAQIILLGTTLFTTVHTAVFLYEKASPSGISKSLFYNTPIINKNYNSRHAWAFQKAAVILLLFAALSSVTFYIHAKAAYQNFVDRNLIRAVSFINGVSENYKVTDATDNTVYLLDVKVLDSITRLPVQNLSASVLATDESETQLNQSYTDSEGSAVFLLSKGNFRLVLYSSGMLVQYTTPGSLSFEFEMIMPGKSELTVLLDKQSYGLPYIKEATLQYIP